MKHDVFISYSRKDVKIAEGLCEVLRQNGVDYWIDDNNIHGSANFLAEITKNLKQCKAVIFVASANSAASEWTQKELLFAIKHSKDIIPYKIGDFSFDDNDELDFVFSNVQWVDSVDKVIVALREKGFVGIKPVPQPPVPEPPVPPTPKPRLPWWVWALIALLMAVSMWLSNWVHFGGGEQYDEVGYEAVEDDVLRQVAKTYNVGDYYNENGKEGVVFDVWDDGRHGKIVSLDETELQWCTIKQYEKKIVVGADSKSDGKANTDKVMARSDADQYPAFTWCCKKGADWYLPAINELELLLLNDLILDEVNKTIAQKGGTKLSAKEKILGYNSSTEKDALCSWFVHMSFDKTLYSDKFGSIYVRAVATF